MLAATSNTWRSLVHIQFRLVVHAMDGEDYAFYEDWARQLTLQARLGFGNLV